MSTVALGPSEIYSGMILVDDRSEFEKELSNPGA
jgi:hypothetical protein